MSVKFGNTTYPANSHAQADYPALRFIEMERTVTTPKTCGACYSVSFAFVRKLQGDQPVPVGLMNAAVAGTGIEGWWYVAPGDPPTPTKAYGKADVVASGPLYKSHQVEGGSIRVKFDHAQHGLMLTKKEGSEPPVPTPDAAMPWLSIQSKDGLPASPFTTCG